MHISDGVLNANIVIGADVLAAVPITYSLIKVSYKEIPKIALMSTIFFIASFIHVPLGPTSIHLILNGLLGIVLGVNAVLAIFVALALQFLLFGYGGITTLGLNTINMFAGALAGYYIYRGSRLSAFFAGFISVFVSAIFLTFSIWLSGEKFSEVAYLAFTAHLPLMFIEGVITMFSVDFLKKIWGDFR